MEASLFRPLHASCLTRWSIEIDPTKHLRFEPENLVYLTAQETPFLVKKLTGIFSLNGSQNKKSYIC